MSPKYFLRTAAAAAVLATGLTAQAGTMSFNGPYHGAYNTVSVVTPNTSYSGGSAGGFAVSLSGFSEFGGSFNGKAFEAYCIDVYEYVGTSSNYSLVTASDYFSAAPAKVAALGSLISYVKGHNIFTAPGVDKDQQSTALQLAIWNIVYDTDNTLVSGPLRETSAVGYRTTAATFVGADPLLSFAQQAAPGGPTYDLYVLKSVNPDGKQDQLIWRQTVPEPASLALVALALGGAAFASRRRRG